MARLKANLARAELEGRFVLQGEGLAQEGQPGRFKLCDPQAMPRRRQRLADEFVELPVPLGDRCRAVSALNVRRRAAESNGARLEG